ncbi:hypothetical protein FT643_09670 [Ketobacter sp. MCCC 1A13808]|uniref:PD-(D/E)XK nuclease family protein n=1 Tax=Ketobacter sp. MCCC 1A13808 TaxID=2602738 RepID=UPI0012EB48CB|nr:PD-(D/E)XK nuclease family protein [Ketobacter sp. MCCC 1A13808]MVF12410.1 hypothetical protein [Ketobacter sp. MCCC 1A13808]
MIPQTLAFDSLTVTDLILTPNRRLSAWLMNDYEQWMLQQGKLAWQPPQALPIDSWLQELFHQHALSDGHDPFPTLLTQLQSRVLWSSIVENELEPGMDLEGVVQLCIQARGLIKRWLLAPDDWQQLETPENRFFCHCYRLYVARLESLNSIDPVAIPELLIKHVKVSRERIKNVYLHGFNDVSEPGLLRLKDWLEQSGIGVHISGQKRIAGELFTIAHADYVDQFRQALLWGVEQWLSQPSIRVGIVVPNLQSSRLKLQQFCEDIASANKDKIQGPWQDVINITAGQPLSQYPIVAHLLLLLGGLKASLSLAEWDILLKSPYFKLAAGSLKQLDALTRFELFDRFVESLKQSNRARYNLDQIETLWSAFLLDTPLPESTESGTPLLEVEDNQSLLHLNKKHGFGQWLSWLERFTRALSWGQHRTLGSSEYQIMQRFREMLRTSWELDPYLTTVTWGEFVRELGIQTRSIVFQPQTETAPIQIMGSLEASGLNFDALWVCECESVNWPQITTPNPLLPRRTLVKFNMPGSGPERELAYAKAMLSGFRSAAKMVMFGWSQFEGEVEHLLSPLLADIPTARFRSENLDAESRAKQQRPLFELIDTLPADEKGSVVEDGRTKGGSALIKAQSLCPFKSFAEYRLGIRSPEQMQDGVKASDRGSLIHKVLESFWTSINSSAELNALVMDETVFDSHLDDLINREMLEFRKRIHLTPEALYALEHARTFSALKSWILNSEVLRQPFTIDRIEKRQSINVAGLELSLTVDRIDELEDGSKIVIDYKTGSVTTSSWLGERPEEPQLPLYTLLDPAQTRGVYFAIVRPDKSEWQGLGEEGIGFSEKKLRTVKTPVEGWDSQVQQWKHTLELLAQEFLQGHATVTPLKETTCQYCHLSSVCRIKELNGADS